MTGKTIVWVLGEPLEHFALLLAAILAIAGLLIAAASFFLRKNQSSLLREIWLRYVSWLAISVLLIGALALGRIAWIAFVGLLALLVFREYARAVGLWLDHGIQAVVYLFIILIHLVAWWPYPDASPHPGWYGLFVIMPIYGIVALLAIPILRDSYQHMLQKLSLAILGLVYFAFFLAHFAFLHNLPGGVGFVLFLAFLVAINDVGAFVAGKLFGRNKMRPRLSPGKTWEGLIGSFVLVQLAAWGLAWLVPEYSVTHRVIVAALIALAAAFGDLATSVIKRDLGIKDWSDSIPGHGGLLDRTNSLIFTAPLFFHYTRYFIF